MTVRLVYELTTEDDAGPESGMRAEARHFAVFVTRDEVLGFLREHSDSVLFSVLCHTDEVKEAA